MAMNLLNPGDYAEQALDITTSMRVQAEEQNWEELTQLESRRSLILEKLFLHPAMPLSLAQVADMLRQIVELDQKTIALGQEARQALKSEMQLLTQGKRAVDAYLGGVTTRQ